MQKLNIKSDISPDDLEQIMRGLDTILEPYSITDKTELEIVMLIVSNLTTKGQE